MSLVTGFLLNTIVSSFSAVPMLVVEALQYSKKEKISLEAFSISLRSRGNTATVPQRNLHRLKGREMGQQVGIVDLTQSQAVECGSCQLLNSSLHSFRFDLRSAFGRKNRPDLWNSIPLFKIT